MHLRVLDVLNFHLLHVFDVLPGVLMGRESGELVGENGFADSAECYGDVRGGTGQPLEGLLPLHTVPRNTKKTRNYYSVITL